MELLNTSPQAIKLNLSYLGQARSNRPSTGHGYENTKPGCILTAFSIPSRIYLLRSRCLVRQLGEKIPQIGTNGQVDLSFLLGKHLNTHLKNHATYGWGPEIHGRPKPRRVLLLVDEAQLAEYLKVWVGTFHASWYIAYYLIMLLSMNKIS